MNQITLQTIKPVVIEMLQNLAQANQRTLEEEITAILENAVFVGGTIDLTIEDRSESKKNAFWKGLQKLRSTIENEGINFADEDFADYDLLKKWEGAVEGGVDDLSFNKEYMEGYGCF